MTKPLQYITIILFSLASLLVGMVSYGQLHLDTAYVQRDVDLSGVQFSLTGPKYFYVANHKGDYVATWVDDSLTEVKDSLFTIKELHRGFMWVDSLYARKIKLYDASTEILRYMRISGYIYNKKKYDAAVKAYIKLTRQ